MDLAYQEIFRAVGKGIRILDKLPRLFGVNLHIGMLKVRLYAYK